MSFNKGKYMSRFGDAHLKAVLWVSTVTSIRANVDQWEQKLSGVWQEIE